MNDNIYKGERRKRVTVSIEVLIPEYMSDEEELEFLNSLVRTFRNNRTCYKKKFKEKCISNKSIVQVGWEYV